MGTDAPQSQTPNEAAQATGGDSNRTGSRSRSSGEGDSRHVSLEEAEELMVLAFSNATDLVADGRLLLDHQRNARAYALGVFACEELGKILVVAKTAALVALGRPVDWTAFWRNFEDHGHKLFNFVSLSTLLEVKPEDWAAGEVEMIDEDADGAFPTRATRLH
jgi:AbiV family abortive infection protein